MQRSTALSSQQGELRHAATGLNALVRVTFIRSLNGIGDSLNGLASAWLLSQFFGAEFSVCWPEANVSWAVPSLSAECITPKREWERRVISQVHGAKNTWDKRNYRDQAWQSRCSCGDLAHTWASVKSAWTSTNSTRRPTGRRFAGGRISLCRRIAASSPRACACMVSETDQSMKSILDAGCTTRSIHESLVQLQARSLRCQERGGAKRCCRGAYSAMRCGTYSVCRRASPRVAACTSGRGFWVP